MNTGSESLRKPRRQMALMAILLALASLITYYFRSVLGLGAVFTHLFYIPIILACIWWKRRGLVVTALLTMLFLFSPRLFGHYVLTVDDYLRALMLLVVSLVIVALSERLSAVKEELQLSEEKYRIVFENTGTSMVIIEDNTIISLANAEFETLSGYSRSDIENQKSFTDFVSARDIKRMLKYHRMRRVDASQAPKNYEFEFINRNGENIDIMITIDMIPGTGKSVASFSDVTELKQALNQQNVLQQRLTETLTKVLSGFIPICANCKKTRDEDNNWVQIESYIQDRTEASFSHGICPECARKLYPELVKDRGLAVKHS
jgi:PAS domain S-box-containing protein